MKIILSSSFMSILFKLLFLLPLLLVIQIIEDLEFACFYIILIVFLQSGILFLFSEMFGFVFFKDDLLFVPSDMQIIKWFKIQYSFSVKIKDIVAIEFVEEQCNSEGNAIPEGKRGTPLFLKIYTKNDEIKRISIIKFSFRTWKKIEEILLRTNNEILVMQDAAGFKKYLKTGLRE